MLGREYRSICICMSLYILWLECWHICTYSSLLQYWLGGMLTLIIAPYKEVGVGVVSHTEEGVMSCQCNAATHSFLLVEWSLKVFVIASTGTIHTASIKPLATLCHDIYHSPANSMQLHDKGPSKKGTTSL